jgi:RHS repeat-associated protein
MTQGYTAEGYVFTASYDAEDRLKAIEYTDTGPILHRTEYNYRGDSLLASIKEYENDTLVKTTHYIRDDLLVLQERDSNNNTLNEYAWGLDLEGGIGGLLHLNQGGQNYSYLYDGKGNVTALINGSQSVVSTYTYDPFGNLNSGTGSLDQPFKFSTKPYDEETGLSYYGYRFYMPAIGKWMTKDPLGERGGINLYGFVGNNPINRIDPLGLDDSSNDGACGPFKDFGKKKKPPEEKKPPKKPEPKKKEEPPKKDCGLLGCWLTPAEEAPPAEPVNKGKREIPQYDPNKNK